MTDNDYIEKGTYTHPSIDGFISPKQYMYIKKDGRRCLLLRFVNDSVHPVNAFEFVLTQLSADGRVLGRSRITYTALTVSPGATYSPDRGIVVDNACVDFRIRLVSVVQGVYKYTVKGRSAVAHYDPRGYRAPKKKANSHQTAEVKSILHSGRRLFVFIAAVALIFIAVSSVTAKYRSMNSLSEMTSFSESQNYLETV